MITLTQAIAGYTLDAQARRLSPHTIGDYSTTFRRLVQYLGNPVLASITTDQLRAFLADLSAPRAPSGVAPRPARPIGKKQLLNIHTALCALWSWAVAEGYASSHIVRDISRPRPEKPAIVPFSQADVKALLGAIDRCQPYQRRGQDPIAKAIPTAVRNRAIVLLLLDTGMRASELCDLQIRQVDLANRRVSVMGKGNKERSLPIGPTTAKSLFRYLTAHRADARANEPVFADATGAPINRNALAKLLLRLGQRAGVRGVHPHRFRHTFAVAYLRNGGNAIALQSLLGHATLDMVRTYVAIAQLDLDNAHRTASPVENWRL